MNDGIEKTSTQAAPNTTEQPIYVNESADLSKLYSMGFGFIFFIVLMVSIYFAKSILLPIIASTFIALLCSPVVNYLVKIGLPRLIGVLAVIFVIVGLIFGGLNLLSGPAQEWWIKLPTLVKDVSQEITTAANNTSFNSAANQAIVNDSNVGEFKSDTMVSLVKSIAMATPTMLTQFMMALFMAYFMLSYGRSLFTGLLMQFDSFENKRKTVELVRTIQHDLSRYIGTVTLINILLGVVVGIVFSILGVDDPFLWGALAGIMNFAPYLGPLISMICFAVVTYVQFDSMSYAFIVISIYLFINMLESQFVTPTLLGKSFNLNPLIIFMWLILWGWLWGSMGMLIGVPLLVCVSTVLERLEIFGRIHLILKER
ncbi:AI-2E family transporter [Psychromonas arctica]|uniref:AI-2E family transporter n=1 Tax=Psychromonas arctica TaxID=168275 RepID=UPI002FD63E33